MSIPFIQCSMTFIYSSSMYCPCLFVELDQLRGLPEVPVHAPAVQEAGHEELHEGADVGRRHLHHGEQRRTRRRRRRNKLKRQEQV